VTRAPLALLAAAAAAVVVYVAAQASVRASPGPGAYVIDLSGVSAAGLVFEYNLSHVPARVAIRVPNTPRFWADFCAPAPVAVIDEGHPEWSAYSVRGRAGALCASFPAYGLPYAESPEMRLRVVANAPVPWLYIRIETKK